MNAPATPIPSELLARYLAGEADAAQRRAVEDWAAATPENAAELDRMRAIWDLGSNATDIPEVDVDHAWGRLEARIAEEAGRARVRSIRPVLTRWFAAAAVVAGIVFALRWYFQPAVNTYHAAAAPVEVLLADSSLAVLAPGSQLEERSGKYREMRLQGQAYFEVRPDEQRPFIVNAGEVMVTVLGTAFEVSAYDTSDHVERAGAQRARARGSGR